MPEVNMCMFVGGDSGSTQKMCFFGGVLFGPLVLKTKPRDPPQNGSFENQAENSSYRVRSFLCTYSFLHSNCNRRLPITMRTCIS